MPGTLTQVETPIEKLDVSVYTVPTDFPESDGTLEWHSTTIVVVEASAGGKRGLGYTYADAATADLINDLLTRVVRTSRCDGCVWGVVGDAAFHS